MAIHVVNKGKEGEREIVRLLNTVLFGIAGTFAEAGHNDTADMLRNAAQRNQNQSAVGGGDINLFGVSIEVKRQETLAVDTWWKQAKASAQRNGDIPILIYRQNRKAWRVVMDGQLWCFGSSAWVRVEVSVDDFLAWFKMLVLKKLSDGETNRV